LIHPLIFSPSLLRRFIEQGFIHAPNFFAPSEGRAGRMHGKLAR
jgi:hypothetical protein